MEQLKQFSQKYLKAEAPVANVGDTVRVHIRVKEGNRERIQVFEGTVIAKKHGGIEETFTVRRVSYGVGVEKVFPLHAPTIEKVETVRHGKVRRAKLYYLRNRDGKAAKVKEDLYLHQYARVKGAEFPLLFLYSHFPIGQIFSIIDRKSALGETLPEKGEHNEHPMVSRTYD